jgi:hypothetical protein
MSATATLLNRPPLLLRRALLADAVASGAVGLLMAAGATVLEPWLGLPVALLRWAGVFLLFYAAFVVTVARRDPISAGGAMTVVIANALWALASIWLLVSGLVAPTLLGTLFVIAQAAVVALLGILQYSGLRSR